MNSCSCLLNDPSKIRRSELREFKKQDSGPWAALATLLPGEAEVSEISEICICMPSQQDGRVLSRFCLVRFFFFLCFFFAHFLPCA